MAPSLVYLLWYIFGLTLTGWVVFNFAARILSRLLGKVLKAKVQFRFAGVRRLRNVSIHFTKGPVASVIVGEIHLKWPLAMLNRSALQKAKLQLRFSDVELSLRKPEGKSRSGRRSHEKTKSRERSKRPGQMKIWPIIVKCAKNVNITVTELFVKAVEVPDLSLEIGDLDLDTFTPEDITFDSLGLRLVIVPIAVHVNDSIQDGDDSTDKVEPAMMLEGRPVLFSLERISVSSSLKYVKDRGLVVQHVEIGCGEAEVNVSEDLLIGDTSLVRKVLLRKSAGENKSSHVKQPEGEGESVKQVDVENPPTEKGFPLLLPEKFGFSLPMFSFSFEQGGEGSTMRNTVSAISIRSCITNPSGQVGEVAAVCDTRMECGEILILEETAGSLLQIQRVSVLATVEFHSKANGRQRVEVDANLEGTRCNLFPNTVDDLLKFCLRLPKSNAKRERVVAETFKPPKKKSKSKLCWVCTFSAPEMGVTAYDSVGTSLLKLGSQSLQFFVDNVSGPACRMQLEVGELQMMMVDEISDDSITLGKSSKSECFLRLGGLVMEWGTSELRLENENKTLRSCSVIIMECSQIGIYLSVIRLRAFLILALSLQNYAKNVFGQKRATSRSTAATGKSKKAGGWRKIEFGVQGLSVQFSEPSVVDDAEVVDPKTMNFGEQGGKVVFTHNNDGILRKASIKSTGVHPIKGKDAICKATFEEVFGLICIDDHKRNLHFSLDRGQVSHDQRGINGNVLSNLTMLAVQNFEVLYEGGSLDAKVPDRLLLSVTNLDGHWNPDMHLFYYDTFLQLVALGGIAKGKSRNEGGNLPGGRLDTSANKRVGAVKQKTRLAIDLERMNFSAKVTQNIDFALHVQSLVSEDVEIGLLVANIRATFNDAQVLHLEQAQICRLPSPASIVSQVSGTEEKKVGWNISVHATKIRTILPFRLQLRAIDDSVEDMWRVLKLAMRAQKIRRNPASAVAGPPKTRKPSATGIGSFLVSVGELTFEIEEEPLQGWLDEHHRLMGREICKLRVQERILEEKRQEAIQQQEADSQSSSTSPMHFDCARPQEMGPEWEELQKEAFSSYRRECKNLIPDDGSGACKRGLQSGFRMSRNRRSLLLVQASDVEMNLSPVAGSMVEAIRKLDCVGPDVQVPFGRVYGRHLSIQGSSLVARLRDYTAPLFESGALGCEGNVIVAQQATCFPEQIRQEVPLGKSRNVEVWRSISGATPAYKTFFDLDLQANSGRFSYGVGYEPAIADMTYAFSTALSKAKPAVPVVKKERSLPWWDDMRYYIHGRNSVKVKDFTWSFLATTNPYEDKEMLQFVAITAALEQSEGSVNIKAHDLEWVISRRSSSRQSHTLVDCQERLVALHAPEFKMGIGMDWKCESGNPLNHYLHPFPNTVNPPTKKFDPFRSISLALTFSFSLFCLPTSDGNPDSHISFLCEQQYATNGKFSRAGVYSRVFSDEGGGGGRRTCHQSEIPFAVSEDPVPTIYFGSQELKWIFRIWSLFYSPPHKLRSFSKWPRFGIKRVPRSGNLSLDKVMTEYLLRVDATPGRVKHRSNLDGDPARGLTFHIKRLRYELLYSRCQSHFESTGPRDPLMSVYQGLDLSMLNAGQDTIASPIVKQYAEEVDKEDKVKELFGLQEINGGDSVADSLTGSKAVNGRGFLLSMDCFTLRKQAPKAGLSQVSNLLHYKRISQNDSAPSQTSKSVEFESGSDSTRSDASDDEGFNVVLADNCLRVSVYGLKLLWTLPNRDAVWSWVGDFSRAFESPKPSPSRQAAQRKALELKDSGVEKSNDVSHRPREQLVENSEEEGVMHFMVTVVQPQFNLHSEDANGRLLLAAASGRVLARSFRSVLAVTPGIMEKAVRKEGMPLSPQAGAPVITWKRRELSVILEHVQAHVAPTDVDLGAGLQWLPKIPTGAPKVRRTGALLERVFMPCSMYFQYTRHKGGKTDGKVKPVKELSFNSPNITATMTSNQFHIMVDVISNLLLARLPKPRKRPLVSTFGEEIGTDEESEEEVDEVVPEGVEEAEVARIKLEETERDCRAVIGHWASMKNLEFGAQSAEIQVLERDFAIRHKERRSAFLTLRGTLRRAAQQRLMEKGKHRAPLAAMRISWAIDKFAWNMFCDGESFAEAEISSMILNVDRDFSDVGLARFTTKRFAVKNCLPGAKSSTVLSPWNPPAEWGRNVMLRVDAKQGAPIDGHSPMEKFQVEIYPLKIYLTESMYRMMWDYLFPEEDQDSVKRQNVRTQHQKVTMAVVSTTAGNQVRNPSFSKLAEDREAELPVDEVNSKGNTPSTAPTLRVSAASNVHSTNCDELQQSTTSFQSATSIDSMKSKEQKTKKGNKMVVQEEKKVTEERMVTRLQKSLLEFHNIKISQVELLVTYEGSRFSVNDMRLLMDTFAREEFTGSWRRLFSKVKKHIIWSVLKSVTGMQGKKFKDKLPAAQSQVEGGGDGGDDSNSCALITSPAGNEDQFPISRYKKHSDRAGEGFVSSIRGLFQSQRRKLGYHSGGNADSPTSPQESANLGTKTRRLLQRHSIKLRSSGSLKGGVVGVQSESSSSSPSQAEAELSDSSSVYEEFHELT